jgi:hypothetical protein
VLIAAAVVPHPPLLVPGVAAGASPEVEDLRAAAVAAVRRVVAAAPDLVLVVGGGPREEVHDGAAWGSLAPYGVPGPAAGHAGRATLPLSLTVAGWLLDQAGVPLRRLAVSVASDAPAAACATLGAALAGRARRVGLVVAGDGSARRSVKGPGYLDPRAEPFDAHVHAALAAGDVDALLALDRTLAAELLAAGRAPWQVLAGAARGQAWSGHVGYDAAPYGVCYLVATWEPAGT